MNVEKFNDEVIVFKARMKFKDGCNHIIYLDEGAITEIVSGIWDNTFIVYTDHKDIYIKRIDDICSINIDVEKSLTETEYEKMLETLRVDNLERHEPVNVLTDESDITQSAIRLLERCNK